MLQVVEADPPTKNQPAHSPRSKFLLRSPKRVIRRIIASAYPLGIAGGERSSLLANLW